MREFKKGQEIMFTNGHTVYHEEIYSVYSSYYAQYHEDTSNNIAEVIAAKTIDEKTALLKSVNRITLGAMLYKLGVKVYVNNTKCEKAIYNLKKTDMITLLVHELGVTL